jgi:signal transduction histidine kinase/CheY-like chemotaxis protein/HPt (histidine-containing phosphotransfer) domain-containing protein
MRYANILIESYSIIISFILALYLYYHRKTVRTQKNWFIVMLASNIGMSVGDMADWIFSGNPAPAAGTMLNIGMVLYFASSGVLLMSYTFYLLAYLDIERKNPAGILSAFFGCLQILLALCSPFVNGTLFFRIGSDHVYHRGELFFLSQVTAGIVYIVQVVLLLRRGRKLQKREVIFLSSYIIIPVVGELLQVIFYEVALLSVGATIALLLIFINVQSTQELRIEKAEAMALAKTDFLASMSHEIRTPINAVLGMNEIIQRESKEKNILEYSANISSAGKKLLGIINDILDFSKIESQKMEIVPAPYCFSSLIYDLYNMISDRAEKKGLALHFHVAPEIPEHLLGDEIRLNQIVLNLLTNAVKYTQEGKVELSVGFVEREEDILLRIEVKDSGIGIRKEDIGKLFSSFQRLDEKRNRAIEGTGLGLSIVKQLVDLMDGELTVHSIYGQGSEFTAVIPQKVLSKEPVGDYRERMKSRIAGEKTSEDVWIAPNARVLAIDDNEMNLKVLQGLLKRTRIQLDLAGSGEEGIQKLQENTYDLILLDHRMPHMDGIETMQKMREMDLLHGVPVIALTANVVSGAREYYIQNGFQDYLSKPINGEKLEERMAKWLPGENLFTELSRRLDTEKAMEYAGNDMEMLTMNLSFFCDNAPKLDESLCMDFEKGDCENYSVHAHALKSNAATIGAMELSEQAKELEFLLKEQDFLEREKKEPVWKEKHERLMKEYRNLVKYLQNRGIQDGI